MSVQLKWSGLTEFLKEFGSIPQVLHEEGMAIIREETEGAAVEIAQAYGRARHTGRLASSVRTIYPASSLLIGIVKSVAPHSHLFEFGSKQRRTQSGANRGAMPKADPPITVPIARRRRSRMARRLVDLLRKHGFQVGNA